VLARASSLSESKSSPEDGSLFLSESESSNELSAGWEDESVTLAGGRFLAIEEGTPGAVVCVCPRSASSYESRSELRKLIRTLLSFSVDFPVGGGGTLPVPTLFAAGFLSSTFGREVAPETTGGLDSLLPEIPELVIDAVGVGLGALF